MWQVLVHIIIIQSVESSLLSLLDQFAGNISAGNISEEYTRLAIEVLSQTLSDDVWI